MIDIPIYETPPKRPGAITRARLRAIHALDTIWTKVTWPIARLLDDHTDVCWARLAMWSLFRGSSFPPLTKPQDCAIDDIEKLGSCWCGKYKDPDRMMEIYEARKAERN